MRLLLDESISHRIAEALEAAGHDVVHVRDRSLLGASDDRVLALAAQEGRTLVAVDTDFGTLLALSGAIGPSVIVFRRDAHRPEAQAAFLIEHAAELEEPCERGCIVSVTADLMRIRALLIGP